MQVLGQPTSLKFNNNGTYLYEEEKLNQIIKSLDMKWASRVSKRAEILAIVANHEGLENFKSVMGSELCDNDQFTNLFECRANFLCIMAFMLDNAIQK